MNKRCRMPKVNVTATQKLVKMNIFSGIEPLLVIKIPSEKWLVYETLKEEILEKIRKLEEDRHAADLWPSGPEWGRRRRRRQVAVSPPYVVYMLPDADIMEDWRIVRKLLEKAE